mmetsp:Transcript_7063/g.18001  ORF Transcript_7063/g.18001 Transcript_7063/m.18001 type:complete len:222 (-) Transcript_7063:91-756(-)
MSNSDDESPEEVTLGAGKEAVIATRKQETTGRKRVVDAAKDAAKKRRAKPEKPVATIKKPKASAKATYKKRGAKDAKGSEKGAKDAAEEEEEEDVEVKELDLDVIEAVAARPMGDGGGLGGGAGVKGGAGGNAERRAVRRAAVDKEDSYVGDGVWDMDGFEVVVAGDANEERPIGTGSARDFLTGKLMGSRHCRSNAMLLDPRTGESGVKVAGAGATRRRR